MDLIAQALAKREKLKSDLGRIETFLATAYELQGEGPIPAPAKSDAEKIAEPVRRISSPRAAVGVGVETAKIAESIVREAGRAMSTRDLVPLVEAHNIEIGGKDKVATLSARLGNDAKRSEARLRLVAGKWHLPEWISMADSEETADTPTKDAPAASFFSRQEGGATYAAPLN